jgi:hypothetical protein
MKKATLIAITFLAFIPISILIGQPINDDIGSAIAVSHSENWCSADAAYNNIDATADGVAGSCWNTGPDYNVWFSFVATTTEVNVKIDRGGSKGTIRRVNLALWEADGVSQLACNRYINTDDDVILGYLSLNIGETYFISVDNNYSAYQGSFTLCLDTQVDYDFYEGAMEIPHEADWCSADAAYTTLGATSDRSAAGCWNTSPDYNRWFWFEATSPFVTLTIDRGGSKGTIRRINAAIWEADGLTEVACNRYVNTDDDVTVGYTNLTVGNIYYISVDNDYSLYRGSFTLCMDNTADYDFYEGAIVVPHEADWCSADAEFTTIGATADRNAAGCWNTAPDYNRWFKFEATTPFVTLTIDRGGSKGTIRRINAAIWEADGLTEVACNRYVNTDDDVTVGYTNLVVGNTYYISVDNNYSGYRGTFTLCMDNTADYDFYEGAIEVPHEEGWCSADAEFTTIGATADRNAAGCWNTSPDFNRWFWFEATTPFVTLTIDRGGSKGTIRRINAAIWEADGLTEVACNRYVNTDDDVTVGFTNLTVGNIYYISVDNDYSFYRGSFTLCMDNSADYDFYEGAIEIPHEEDWCSADAAYSTLGATADRNAASCWNTAPDYNRWFRFEASTPFVTLTIDRGGSKGTIRRINAAIWEEDGLTEVACNRYVNADDDVTVGYTNLTVGNTYYISVDNNYSGYRGTFTVCIDNTADYDFYEGAIEIPHEEGWCSEDAIYTTIGATPDRNAAGCWNTAPNYNRWFRFEATSPFVTLTIDRGGSKGTIRNVNAAIWEADGMTEVACNRYVNTNDDVTVGYTNLTVGNLYYISVDNNYSGYRGTFTVCLDNTADYDFYEGATEIPHEEGWCSEDAIYTTIGATPDRNAAGCWNTAPNYNRWFRFEATSPFVTLTIDRGGSKGTIRRINAAVWEADGLTEVACNRYVNTDDDVTVGFTNLTVGNTYYISVDNNYSFYRGSFTLCIDNTADYDFYEGAIVVPHEANWCSDDAAYTTIGATPDRNAGSCWDTSPDYNRWFRFEATTPFVTLTIDRGGSKGTIRRINAALWEADGLTEVACNRYVNTDDDVTVGYTNLTVGNEYYVSVDNNYSLYRGSFTLCIDNQADYDFYEGAFELTDINNFCSNNGQFTTVGATPDKNAASCWNTAPNYNRWFKFQASATGKITITALRGGSYGTLRRINMAVWEADGITEIACDKYINNNDNITIQLTGLTEGNWYYISVDNNYGPYRGSFTLCLDDERMRWNGNNSTDWNDPGNWSFAYIPSATDDVLIPSGLSNYPFLNSGSNAVVKSMVMEPGTRLTIPVAKTLTVLNDIVMEANAFEMASLIEEGELIADPSRTSFECFIPEEMWHLVASPVTDAKSEVFLDLYLKYFTEPDSAWHYITSLNTDLLPGQGFASWASNLLTGSVNVTYTGEFNKGDQTPPPLSYNSGPNMGDGWNLLGNPFPSGLEWNTNWSTTNIDASIYVYDGATGQYLLWNRTLGAGTMPNGEIPPAQGFWVKANGSGPDVTIPQSERIHTGEGFYKSSIVKIAGLLVEANGCRDEMLIHFNSAASNDFDSEYDAYKIRGKAEAPQIYSSMNGTDLTLNSLPPQPALEIPVGFELGVEGKVTMMGIGLDQFKDDCKFYIYDNQLKKIFPLTETTIYEFFATPSDDPQRFVLHVEFFAEKDPTQYKTSTIEVLAASKNIYVSLEEHFNSKIYVFDMMGRLVTQQNGEPNSINVVPVHTKTGMYVVKVVAEGEVYSEKVFVK